MARKFLPFRFTLLYLMLFEYFETPMKRRLDKTDNYVASTSLFTTDRAIVLKPVGPVENREASLR